MVQKKWRRHLLLKPSCPTCLLRQSHHYWQAALIRCLWLTAFIAHSYQLHRLELTGWVSSLRTELVVVAAADALTLRSGWDSWTDSTLAGWLTLLASGRSELTEAEETEDSGGGGADTACCCDDICDDSCDDCASRAELWIGVCWLATACICCCITCCWAAASSSMVGWWYWSCVWYNAGLSWFCTICWKERKTALDDYV